MKIYSEKALLHIKSLVEFLMDRENPDTTAIQESYYKLLGYADGIKVLIDTNRDLINVDSLVDVEFVKLIEQLEAFLGRGGFDFPEWKECLMYIMYDCNDEIRNFERDTLNQVVNIAS